MNTTSTNETNTYVQRISKEVRFAYLMPDGTVVTIRWDGKRSLTAWREPEFDHYGTATGDVTSTEGWQFKEWYVTTWERDENGHRLNAGPTLAEAEAVADEMFRSVLADSAAVTA